VIPDAVRNHLVEVLGERVQFDVPMERYTSLRVGGPADAIVLPKTREELRELIELCQTHETEYTVLGAGFNTIVSDAGIAGIVIHLKKFRRLEHEGTRLLAGVGVSHHRLMKYCTEHGLAGLEFGAGIPGTIGGWLFMNAGIGDREVKDVIDSVEIMEPSGKAITLKRDELDFRYRRLAGLAPGAILLSAHFKITPCDPQQVKDEIKRLLSKRASSQPLDIPTCGSVFKNPPGDYAGRPIEEAGLKGESE